MDISDISVLFCGECRDGVDQMEAGLLALGRGENDADTINRVFRAAHSIKGGGATFGFPQLSELAHVMETLLSGFRAGTHPILADHVQLLLDATDHLRAMLDRIAANEPFDLPDRQRLIERLNQATTAPTPPAAELAPAPPSAIEPEPIAASEATLEPDRAPVTAITTPDPVPIPDSPESSEAVPQQSINKQFVAPVASVAQSIRIDIDKIDRLINLVGELLITQSALKRFQRASDRAGSDDFNELLIQIDRNSRELQDSVLSIRMLPVHVLFSRLPRLVRDLSRRLGKKVDLILSGESTEVDKTILERLADPLAHLVRNALDHGIEMPEVRVGAGKPATARIELRAAQTGGRVLIDIADDGAGLNLARIRDKAIRSGLVSAHDHLGDQELGELIFLPGFSTVDTVSDVSGRGVGMDIVKQSLNLLGGSIALRSTPGQGTCFSISLPLSLAIIDGQMVRCGSSIYALPISVILELVEALPSAIRTLSGGGESILLRQHLIPVLRLRDAFGIPIDRDAPTILVIVDFCGQQVAIAVDAVLEQQQIVVKNLDDNYKPVPGLSGATILGDGQLALIIDVGGLIRASAIAKSNPAADIAA